MSSALGRGQLTPLQGFRYILSSCQRVCGERSLEVVVYLFSIVMTVIGWVALLGETWFATGT
jgi:hypothetical protein